MLFRSGVAKACLLSQAEHVIIASSHEEKINNAVAKLLAEPKLQGIEDLKSRVSGSVLDLSKSKDVSAFFQNLDEFDHLVITSGTVSLPDGGFKDIDVDANRGVWLNV